MSAQREHAWARGRVQSDGTQVAQAGTVVLQKDTGAVTDQAVRSIRSVRTCMEAAMGTTAWVVLGLVAWVLVGIPVRAPAGPDDPAPGQPAAVRSRSVGNH